MKVVFALFAAASASAPSAGDIARAIVNQSKICYDNHSADEAGYASCAQVFCSKECNGKAACQGICVDHSLPLFGKFAARAGMIAPTTTTSPAVEVPVPETRAAILAQAEAAGTEAESAMADLQAAQARMVRLNVKIQARGERMMRSGDEARGKAELAKVRLITSINDQVTEHLANVAQMREQATTGRTEEDEPEPQMTADGGLPPLPPLSMSFLQVRRGAPEDDLAQEMTHDLEMNFNKIAPFGKEDTAKELQDHAAKTQDTLVDAVENAEVAEIKRAVFRALTRLRAATIKEFDTIARLETQAIDAYNDAHHYRAENPLTHLHEDEAPVETDKLKSFH